MHVEPTLLSGGGGGGGGGGGRGLMAREPNTPLRKNSKSHDDPYQTLRYIPQRRGSGVPGKRGAN